MAQPATEQQSQLNRRWRRPLIAFFSRRMRSGSEAEDLTQEVFLKMLARDDADEMPDSYVFQIASNLLADRLRREVVRKRYRESLFHDQTRSVDRLDPHEIISGQDALRRFTLALEELPERTRAIFLLYRLERIGQAAIAETYGISASAVKQHVAKAMAHMMKKARDAE